MHKTEINSRLRAHSHWQWHLKGPVSTFNSGLRSQLEHTPQEFDWRLVIAATGVCLAALLVLVHLIDRHAVGSQAVPGLLPWVRYTVAFSLCATLLPLAGAADRITERVPVAALFACLGIAFAFAFLQAGAAGIIETIHAVRIALTSREAFGLAPAALVSAIVVRELTGGFLGPLGGLQTVAAFLFLPGPLFPVFCLVSPGNERLIASVLLPVALGCSLGLLLVNRAKKHLFRSPVKIAALFGTVLVFYSPVIRGIASAGECAVVSLAGLVGYVFVCRQMSRNTVLAVTTDFRRLRLFVLALVAGIAVHHAVGLLWLVDGGSSPILVLILGVVATFAFVILSRRAKHCMVAAYALAAPFVAAPLLNSVLEAAAHVPHWSAWNGSLDAPRRLARLAELPINRWIELDSLGSFTPRHRAHSGADFDSKRGQLVMLGSDTHGWDWETAVFRFDLQNQEWRRSGAAEPAYTYRTDRLHRRVAGSSTLGPWAMHAYDQLVIDPKLDALWLVSAPLHNNVPTVGAVRDAVWTFDLSHAGWHMQPDNGSPPVFFSAVAVYDGSRDTLLISGALETAVAGVDIGEEGNLKPGRAWELGPSREHWQPVGGVSPHGRNVTGIFDESFGALLVFERKHQFLVYRYVPAPLPGGNGVWSTRALPDGNCAHRVEYPAVPSVFVGHLGKTLLLPEGPDGRRRTCLYDANMNSVADLGITPPPGISMNFTLVYDRVRSVVLLVTGEPYTGRAAQVWVLRLASTHRTPSLETASTN